MTSLRVTTITELEQRDHAVDRVAGSGARRATLAAVVVVVGWSAWSAGLGRRELVNEAGWSLFARFWRAAVRPEVSGSYLRETIEATLTTISFAVLGTSLAVAIGIAGSLVLSQTWWAGRRRGHLALRAAAAFPRGVHEAIWALFLINVLGRDPLVGILSIALPFGAITAKVYADLIDETPKAAYEALRTSGAGRLVSIMYGVLPQTLPDFISYGFYRLECSLRSAVILGMIGAGGLGTQLQLSFAGLRYNEMWTAIYALLLVNGAADAWGSRLRQRAGTTSVRGSAAAGVVLVGLATVQLRPDLGRLFSARTWTLLRDLASDMWPPRLPIDGWRELIEKSVDTLQMSVLAIAIATAGAIGIASIAARGGASRPQRALSHAARALLLLTRAVPPPVWALLALFLLFPGPFPGAVAMGVYNFGVLGRLMSEVVENLDDRPAAALRALGAPGLSSFAYGRWPLAAGRFAAYSMYRWEVTARETVVVGVVGAGGLGRLLEEQRAAFNYAGMVTTVLALIAVSVLVDFASTRVRAVLR